MTGLGVTTYNRPKYFKKCINHIIKNVKSVDFIVVVNDGSDRKYLDEYKEIYRSLPKEIKVIEKEENGGCSKAKNTLLKEMISAGCSHLFICEDDILILDDRAITEYIRIGEEYGFHNLCFALHGPINIGKRLAIPGEVAYYPDSVGAFCYYSREAIEKCGMFDEEFYNAMEHVELTNRVANEGLTLSFSMFPDVAGAENYVSEIEGAIDNSSIRPDDKSEEKELKFRKNILNALEHWRKKDGHRFPLWDLLFSYRRKFG